MAKLTLTFRGNTLQIHRFDSGIITIGRDPDNTICVDSLAIAPKHIIIDFDHPEGPRLIREDDQFPVRINGKVIEHHQLAHGDEISLGKHTIHFTAEEWRSENPEPEPSPEYLDTALEAGLQILNGKNIGRLIPIKHPMTRLGNPGGSIAIISMRQNGFFLSSLNGGHQIKVNGKPIGDQTIQLNHGDRLEIDHSKLLFYV